MSQNATWCQFNEFAAAATFDRYPLWNSIHKFSDPVNCTSYGFSIVHELNTRKDSEKCNDEPSWKR